ncbi:TrkA C-terminal domain-containing protein [Neobacillus sp. NRS-1170]|uniref:TrkA C-terminal domain-containing protein n=1 Tax=Neobacillus sp. NRS-1170 TaxID=3233898 RepID=UPI003D296A6E
MNLFFLFIYFIIITVVIEIHVILFQLTGLKVEVSRFQVISMMTGTGFTTGESELILGHPIRRKLAAFLILFGAFSLAVIISSISNFLTNELNMKEVLSVAGCVLLTFIVLKLAWVQKILSLIFNRKLVYNIELGDMPVRDVFLTDKQDHLLNLRIYEESRLVSKTLGQFIHGYDQMDIAVLFIKRGDLKIRRKLYDTKIHEGDQIFIFGDKRAIIDQFKDDISIMEAKLKTKTI